VRYYRGMNYVGIYLGPFLRFPKKAGFDARACVLQRLECAYLPAETEYDVWVPKEHMGRGPAIVETTHRDVGLDYFCGDSEEAIAELEVWILKELPGLVEEYGCEPEYLFGLVTSDR